MKLLNFVLEGKPRLGLLVPGGVVDVSAVLPELCSTDQLILRGEAGLAAVKRLGEESHPLLNEEDICYAPAVLSPQLVLCVGLNYKAHVEEAVQLQQSLPAAPVWFNKFASSLVGHRQQVPLCPVARQHDAEAELVAVIGRAGRNIKKQDAHAHLYGYTLGNDLSARDLQFRSSQWLIGKALPGFGPLGPVLVPKEDIDEAALDISGRINGELRQHGRAQDMLFDVDNLIADASQFFHLQPGDLIFTGTPEGVIMGRKPPLEQNWLKAGDVVTVESSQIGVLSNTMVSY